MTRKIVRSYTATDQDLAMLEAVARYHGFSKSGTLTSLVRKEFWRLFPAGTGNIKPDQGARVAPPPTPPKRRPTGGARTRSARG